MKKTIALVALVLSCVAAQAELYKVTVRRVDQDLYRTTEGVFIKTRYCYEYSYGDEAILDYDGGYGGKLIFPNSGTSCEVDRVFR